MDKEKQLSIRNEIQDKAVELSGEHKHLLLTWATGSGKGLAVARCIAESRSVLKWLIVVPEILQIENYKQDLVKHGMDKLLGDVIEDIICYASLFKYEGRELNIAFNEAHRLSNMRWDIAKTIKFDQIISDSATVPDEVKERLEDLCPFHEYNISMDEAIELGILPAPKIFLIGVDLDTIKKTHSYKIKGRVYKVTAYGYNRYLDEQIFYWRDRIQSTERDNEERVAQGFTPLSTEWMSKQIVMIGLRRKKFLSEYKTKKAEELLLTLKEKRYLCFCGSIDQAIELGGKQAIHSKKTPKVNKEILESFNKGEIDHLYLNKMLREGLNPVGIEAVVVIQLDSGNDNGLSFIQITGRGMRADAPELYILFVRGSQDVKFLKRALENVDNKYIKNL